MIAEIRLNKRNKTIKIVNRKNNIRLTHTGKRGPQGPIGPDGADGADGLGVPIGGTTGQVLSKNSNTDFDTEWTTPAADAVTSVNGRTGAVSGLAEESDVTTALSGKANTSHTHVTSDVTGLDTALSGKAATSHTHTASQVTDFDTEVSNNTDVAANTSSRHTHANSAVLDATTASFTTADETKLDSIAIGAQVNTVTSVNTRTGAVTGLAEASDLTAHTGNTSNPHSVTKSQVGLSNVDNTSDVNKNSAVATLSNKTIDGGTY